MFCRALMRFARILGGARPPDARNNSTNCAVLRLWRTSSIKGILAELVTSWVAILGGMQFATVGNVYVGTVIVRVPHATDNVWASYMTTTETICVRGFLTLNGTWLAVGIGGCQTAQKISDVLITNANANFVPLHPQVQHGEITKYFHLSYLN
jgi:hypothetical protein